MTDFFCPDSSHLLKPYALMDLDDTLFQTRRKIDAWQLPSDDLTVATVDKQGEPLSFFTPKQARFFNWLLHSTELIPITARDTQEILRVKLSFSSWQVLTHGAVILQPDGQPLSAWQHQMQRALQPLQTPLSQLTQVLIQLNEAQNLGLVLTPHNDNFQGDTLSIYLAVKHRDKDADALLTLAKQLSTLMPAFDRDFYVHVNANNLAILPQAVHKRHALIFLQAHCLDSTRPSFGFGDSLADLPFLQLLDWYGTPARGQLHSLFSTLLDDLI